MKSTFTALLLLASLSSFAGQYDCHSIWGKDVGIISLVGDPVLDSFDSVTVNGVKQNIRQSTFDAVFLYLSDVKTKNNTYALEVVNYPSSYESFQMSVFGEDHIVLGSFKIARYNCLKSSL